MGSWGIRTFLIFWRQIAWKYLISISDLQGFAVFLFAVEELQHWGGCTLKVAEMFPASSSPSLGKNIPCWGKTIKYYTPSLPRYMLSWINDKCFSCVMFKLLNMVSFLSLKHPPLIQTLMGSEPFLWKKYPTFKFLWLFVTQVSWLCVAGKAVLTWGIFLILFSFNKK